MITLYQCLFGESGDARRVIDAAQGVEAAYPMLKLNPGESPHDGTVQFVAGDAEAFLSAGPLGREDQAALASYGSFKGSVLFAVRELTPENGGLCWDALVAACISYRSTVWLSRDCYDEQAISRSAPLRPAILAGDAGFILRHEEFLRLVDEH